MKEPYTDFLIIAPLAEEREALLRRLPDHRKLPATDADVYVYYEARMPIQSESDGDVFYRLIVTSPSEMTRVPASNLAARAIERFAPRKVLLVGIAGGVQGEVQLGDVLVAAQIVDYEHQKVTKQGPLPRYHVHSADERLVIRAQHLTGWESEIEVPRPEPGRPTRRIGPVASGDKVLATAGAMSALREAWPKLLGVEMEAGGVFAAAHSAAQRPGVLMIRAVSDLADEAKGSSAVEAWRGYACDVAAAFAIALLKDEPVPRSRPARNVGEVPDRNGAPQSLSAPLRERRLPLGRNPSLVGRNALLGHIRKLFVSNDAPLPCVILSGLRGVGKTQLALEYAYRHSADQLDYPWVFWLRAASLEFLRSDLAALASVLELPEAKRIEPEQQLAAVVRWLESTAGWLLIIDGADDAEARAWLSGLLPAKGAGHVLITSTSPNWHARGCVVPVAVLAPEDSVKLLTKRSGLGEASEAWVLAETLGWLPLALVQAAAYMEQTGITYGKYLQLFRARQPEMLARPSLEDYPQTVATTWSLSFEQVCQKSPTAESLLNLCAFMAPIPFPLELLRKFQGNRLPPNLSVLAPLTDSLAQPEAVAVLRAYSLLDVANDHIWFHPLVQAMVRHRLGASAKSTWATISVSLLRECAYPARQGSELRLASDFLFPHAWSCVGYALELDAAHDSVAHIALWLGAYLRAHVSGQLAVDFLDRVEQKCLPALNRTTAVCWQLRAEHAQTLALLGKWEKAVALLDEALGWPAVREPAEDATAVATLLLGRGNALMIGGRHQSALDSGLELMRRLASDDQGSQRVLWRHANSLVGLALVSLARHAEGKEYLEKSLAGFAEAERQHSSDWAIVMHNFGLALESLGDVAGAAQSYRQAIAHLEMLWGVLHPQTGRSRLVLGQLLLERGEIKEARSQFRRAFWSARATPVATQHQLAEALNSLGTAYLYPGYFKRARTLATWALQINQSLFSGHHPDTYQSLTILARALQGCRELNAARDCFELARKAAEAIYGAAHPEMASLYHNFGMLLLDTDDAEQGLQMLERALLIDESCYGKEHYEVATDLSTLGLCYIHQGKWEQALPLFERALTIRNKQFDGLVPRTLEAIEIAARMLSEQGAWPLSLRYHKLLIAALECAAESNPVSLVLAIHHYADALQGAKELATAMEQVERALALAQGTAIPVELRVGLLLQQAGIAARQKQSAVAEKALVAAEEEIARHPDKEWTSAQVSILRSRGKQKEKALDFAGAAAAFEEARLLLDVPDCEDPIRLANTLTDLGHAEMQQRKFAEARPHLLRALDLTLRERGETHPTTGTIYRRLGEISRALGEHATARDYFEKTYRIWKRVYGENDSYVLSALRDLGGEEMQLGQLAAAQEHLGNAQAAASTDDEEQKEDRCNQTAALAQLYVRQNKLSEAKELIDRALVSQDFADSSSRLSISVAQLELGSAFAESNAIGSAIECFQRVATLLESMVDTKPLVHEALAKCLLQLGMLFRQCNRPKEAAGFMARAYHHIQQTARDERDTEFLSIALNHANYLRFSSRTEAKQVLSQVLSFLSEPQNAEQAQLQLQRARAQAMLGETLLHLDEPQDAVKHLSAALEAAERDPAIFEQPGTSPDILTDLYSYLGKGLLKLNQEPAKAIEYLRTALRQESARYGQEHARTALAAFELAKGLRQNRQMKEAKHFAKLAHQIFHRTGPTNLAKQADALHRQLRSVVVQKSGKKK